MVVFEIERFSFHRDSRGRLRYTKVIGQHVVGSCSSKPVKMNSWFCSYGPTVSHAAVTTFSRLASRSMAGLRMSGEVLRIAADRRLGTGLCESHACKCGVIVEPMQWPFSYIKGAGRQQRHGIVNNVIWWPFTTAKIPTIKEPNGLSTSVGKRPEGVTVIPWARLRQRPLLDVECHGLHEQRHTSVLHPRTLARQPKKQLLIRNTNMYYLAVRPFCPSCTRNRRKLTQQVNGETRFQQWQESCERSGLQSLSVALENSLSVLGASGSEWNNQKKKITNQK